MSTLSGGFQNHNEAVLRLLQGSSENPPLCNHPLLKNPDRKFLYLHNLL